MANDTLPHAIERAALIEIEARLANHPFSSHAQAALLVSLATAIGYLPEPEKSSALKLYTDLCARHPEGVELSAYCARFVQVY